MSESEVPDHSGIAKDLRNNREVDEETSSARQTDSTVGRENALIVIGGGSASGKSTLASKIEEKLDDCVVLSLDDYYVDDPEVSRDHPHSIDWGELKTDVLRLINGRVTTVPTFDFETDERGHQDSVKPTDVIVVEGLWACDFPERAGIVPDHSAYVYVDDELRLARRVLRDVEERGCDTHEVVERWQDEVRPHHAKYVDPTTTHSDHLVDGSQEQMMDDFVAWLSGRDWT